MSKFRNVKTARHNITFDSKMEADYYDYLLERDDIQAIDLQPTYLLQPAFKKYGVTIRKIEYKADFLITYNDGRTIAVDVKGALTEVFKLKAKLFHFCYPDLELHLITKHKGEWIHLKDKPGVKSEKRKRLQTKRKR